MNNNAQTKQTESKPNITLVLTIIIIAILALSIGGYFAWKYVSVLLTNPSETTQETLAIKKHSQKINILENVLRYPNFLELDKETDTDTGSKLTMKMLTSDDVTTVYLYYEELILGNNWVENGKGLATDLTGGYFRIEEKNFQADINIKQLSSNTSIEISIYFENDDINFSHIKPDISINNTSNIKKPDSQSTQNIKNNEYIIYDSDTRIIDESELHSLSNWELKLARNEIYARHGRKFEHQDLSCYFAKQNWYSIDPNYKETNLNKNEQKNIATILDYEKKVNSDYTNRDSGCK